MALPNISMWRNSGEFNCFGGYKGLLAYLSCYFHGDGNGKFSQFIGFHRYHYPGRAEICAHLRLFATKNSWQAEAYFKFGKFCCCGTGDNIENLSYAVENIGVYFKFLFFEKAGDCFTGDLIVHTDHHGSSNGAINSNETNDICHREKTGYYANVPFFVWPAVEHRGIGFDTGV